jgi:hypothetical protein
MLRIFIALKIPSPWPGSNPQALRPVESTLSTSTPRGLPLYITLVLVKFYLFMCIVQNFELFPAMY